MRNSAVTNLRCLSHLYVCGRAEVQSNPFLCVQDPFSAADCCDEFWYVVSGETVKEPQESRFDVGSNTFCSFLHLRLTFKWGLTLDHEWGWKPGSIKDPEPNTQSIIIVHRWFYSFSSFDFSCYIAVSKQDQIKSHWRSFFNIFILTFILPGNISENQFSFISTWHGQEVTVGINTYYIDT